MVVGLIMSVLVIKGLWFYVLLSFSAIYQFYYSITTRKYCFGRLIIYDLALTLMLSLFSLLMPIANFLPLSPKSLILFWNYYIFLMIIGVMVMKLMINI